MKPFFCRWAHLIDVCKEHGGKIEDALKVQQFLRDTDETEAWLKDKLQVASDASYKNPTNLATKVQAHDTFEAEVNANEKRIASVIEDGKKLATESPDGDQLITPRVTELDSLWNDLVQQSSDKSAKLKQASNQQQFNDDLDDIELWLGEIETALSTEDSGRDLVSVQSLMAKHNRLEADVIAHQPRIDAIATLAQTFVSEGHFDVANILERQGSINTRYLDVHTLCASRRETLAGSLQKQQTMQNMNEAESWMREMQLVASSHDYGKDLTGVKNLLKKHGEFHQKMELEGAKQVVGVVDGAKGLVVANHFAKVELRERITALETQWSSLKVTT